MAESNLRPDAKSWVGARGIMQLMPSTYAEVQSQNPEIGEIDDPQWNIVAGIYYDRQLWRQWEKESEELHRKEFTLASYNAGRGTMRRAQRVARDQALDYQVWPSIEEVAPSVPKWRHEETLTYVDRINANLARMDDDGRVVR